MKGFLKNDKGQSMVEMALVMPLLLLLMFSIIEGGMLFANYVELQNKARDGARYASIHSSEYPTASLTTEQWRDTNLTPRLNSNVLLLDPDNLNINLTKNSDAADSWVEVQLTYTLKLLTPLIGDLIADDPANNTIDLTARITMRGE